MEFVGPGGKHVAYDAPHPTPGPGHDKPHVGWASGKKSNPDARRGNITYDGPQHPSRAEPKDKSGDLSSNDDAPEESRW